MKKLNICQISSNELRLHALPKKVIILLFIASMKEKIQIFELQPKLTSKYDETEPFCIFPPNITLSLYFLSGKEKEAWNQKRGTNIKKIISTVLYHLRIWLIIKMGR